MKICNWCEETNRFSGESWTLINKDDRTETEQFEFCCYTCLMRWVNA